MLKIADFFDEILEKKPGSTFRCAMLLAGLLLALDSLLTFWLIITDNRNIFLFSTTSMGILWTMLLHHINANGEFYYSPAQLKKRKTVEVTKVMEKITIVDVDVPAVPVAPARPLDWPEPVEPPVEKSWEEDFWPKTGT